MAVQTGYNPDASVAARRRNRAATADVSVRLSRPADRDAILRLVRGLGFNARDEATWDGLGMVAMTAWYGPRLVGAIPLEPRWWQLRPGCVVSTVHQTTVGVLPEYHGRGIGSAMQDAIYAYEPALASVATVFREDETSPAYKWYRRNGFEPAMRVSAWVSEKQTGGDPANRVELIDQDDPGVRWTEIGELWRTRLANRRGGFVCRGRRPLRDWLRVHPYRQRYTFKILHLRDADGLVAYAVLGIGRLHSATMRVEIMEHAVRGGEPSHADQLCRSVLAFATRHGYRPVRWALAEGDPALAVVRRNNFQRNWAFDLLWRPLSACQVELPGAAERAGLWRYHSLDYA